MPEHWPGAARMVTDLCGKWSDPGAALARAGSGTRQSAYEQAAFAEMAEGKRWAGHGRYLGQMRAVVKYLPGAGREGTDQGSGSLIVSCSRRYVDDPGSKAPFRAEGQWAMSEDVGAGSVPVTPSRPRLRAVRADVQIGQRAQAAVLPTNQHIGPWQRNAARLAALAQKYKATGADSSAVAREARELLVAIESQRKSWLRDVSSLPDSVAGHSRLADTERALQSVRAVLVKTLGLLGEKPHGSS